MQEICRFDLKLRFLNQDCRSFAFVLSPYALKPRTGTVFPFWSSIRLMHNKYYTN